ncbi:MAG: methionyl-tRNA formyltransferase [Planctomycetota bacterium]|jgi:methionyl-tRNA formyltransferase
MNNNIVILGHGIGVKLIIESLKKNIGAHPYSVVSVFTHPLKDHKRDLDMISNRKNFYGDYAYNIFNVTKDYGVDLIESEDVNKIETINKIKEYNPKYIISVGCRNILKNSFLDHFIKKVINVHTTPLPKYRGAASDSWMILNNEFGKELYGCVHFIDSGIDTGDIIAKSHYTLPEKGYPIDIFKTRMNIFNDIILKALSNLETPNFIAEKQIKSNSTTFPRLHTPTDGKLNFDRFNGHQLELFIYAFGYPFEGAFCYFEKQKINILEAEFVSDSDFHPFSYGLIFGKDSENCYKVSVNGGYLLIKIIEVNGENIKQSSFFRLGRYLK